VKHSSKRAEIRSAICEALEFSRAHDFTKDHDIALEVVVRLAERGFGIVRRMKQVGPTATGNVARCGSERRVSPDGVRGGE